jgi:CheY-like chemotaxis protein
MVDVVILDLIMPNTNGFQVLETLRENHMSEKLPVIILTAKHIEKQEMEVLKKNHVRQLIQKGNINGKVLTEVIAEVLSPPKMQKKDAGALKKSAKKKVLIIEDNMDNMISVKALLPDKFEVLMATNGEMGIQVANEKMPDLILMDINLPGMSGIEAFEEIRKQDKTKSIPIIALTASVMPYQKKETLEHGFDAFVEKPIVLDKLMSAIEEVTDV